MRRRRSFEAVEQMKPFLENKMLRSILSCIGEAVVTTDLEGRVTFMNPVAQQLTGWSLQAASGAVLDTILHLSAQDSLEPVENPVGRVLVEEAMVSFGNDRLLAARDGTHRPIAGCAAPIRDDSGETAGIVLVFRDVTESRRAEHVVLDHLADAQSIIATLREPFLVLQQDLRVVSANQAFYRTFRTSRAETENRCLYELGDRQWDSPRLRALLEDVLTRDDCFENFEVEEDFGVIGAKTMLLNGRRIQPPGSNAKLILLAMKDVTESRQVGHALQVSETRYRRLFETARDGILILDSTTGHILDANPFMVELLGYTHEELCGKQLWQIGLFSDIDANRIAFAELQARRYVRYHNLPLQTRAGEQIEVEFVSNVYREGNGTVIQCNIRDHTEHSRLERYSKEQAEALADAYRRKDEFLAMLSHELRNPLSAIGNAVQLLRLEKSADLVQQQARDIVVRQAGVLASLLEDLLEVSRITTGKLQLHCALVDARNIVANAVEAARPLIDARRHALSVSLPRDPVWVHGDPTRLEQVIVNLLHNAAKYTDTGGAIGLTVRCEDGFMVLRVRDTGVGMAPETLPLIFNLFMQVERSLERAQGGLGVGLTLVRKLVELHGGTVHAASAGLGQGSEFTVRLPVALPQAMPSAPDLPASAVPAVRKRVLVVDDNADAADIIAMLLKHDGHEVRTAYTGTGALDAAIGFEPELVLLDLGLPGMDGYEVARALRQQAGFEKTCLVAFTGYGQEADRQSARQAGFDHHWVKPVEYSKVQALLDELGIREVGA